MKSTASVGEKIGDCPRISSQDKPIVLFVGKFRYYKGLQFLVPAMKKVDARLALVGEGPMRPKLDTIVRLMGIEERVHFAGEVSDEDLPAWYHAADVFCMPSHLRSEAFGVSQVEAMACGLPVVGCDVESGAPFVNQNGETGLIVEKGNWRAIVDGLAAVLGDEETRLKMGRAAFKRAHEEFSVEKMNARLRDVYNGVLE